MTSALALAAALVAVLASSHRTLALLNAARETERKEWTRERQLLLNRIKPETAQYVTPEEVFTPAAVSPFSDDDYWESKEELAERMAREELAR